MKGKHEWLTSVTFLFFVTFSARNTLDLFKNLNLNSDFIFGPFCDNKLNFLNESDEVIVVSIHVYIFYSRAILLFLDEVMHGACIIN